MNTKKEKLLKKAYDEYLNLMLYDFPVEKISKIVVNDVTGYGTTLDEKVLEIKRLKKIVTDQREQGAGIDLQISIMPVHCRISPDEDAAIYMDEFEISMVVDGAKNVIPVRLSSVFEFSNNAWKLVHLHGSKAVETEEDTWHLNEWKQKSEQLQILVDEKTAELLKQNRELEIEAAIERVRARALAMRNSSEVGDASTLLFSELEKMDINPSGFSIMIFDNAQDKYELWRAKEVANQGVYETFSIKGMFDKLAQYVPGFGEELKSSWKKGKPFFVGEIRGKKRVSFIQANREMANYSDDEFEKMKKKFPDPIFWHLVFFKHGWFGALQNEKLSEKDLLVIHRFAEVFDFAFTRFLDLQKAEAQAREAQIQLALERVRARTMAMQRSEDLNQAASDMFKQIEALGMHPWGCGFNIFDKDEKAVTQYMSLADGGISPPFRTPLTEDPFFIRIFDSRQKEEELLVMESSGESLAETYSYMFSLPGSGEIFGDLEKSGFVMPKFQITHCAFFSQGYLVFITYEPVPQAHDLFKRFAKVFEQTYTRFLDLQKAEAQAREAEIELALERVRARTMAMQKSDELSEVSLLLFQQIKSLGVNSFGSGFNIWNKEEKVCTAWMAAGEDMIGKPMQIPLTEDPTWIKFYESRLKGEDFWVKEVGGEELAEHYRYFQTLPAGENIRKIVASGTPLPTFQINHVANFAHGNLMFITFEPVPEAHDIFIRFAKVFEQTYTRFLDLQKAEAQARESKIEAALERVRSRSMGMQHSDELTSTASLLFQQIQTLGVPPWSCGFNIWEQGDSIFTSYMGGGSENFNLEGYKIPLTEEATFIHFQESRDRGDKLFIDVLEGETLEAHYRYFMSLPGIKEVFKKAAQDGLPLPTFQINHLANFSHGNLMFITYEPCPEAHDIFIRFARVFEQTYTRFLDLQKAEAQAREAEIELALERVRARTMAMQYSDELAEASFLLDTQVRALGIKTRGCAFNIYGENDSTEWFSSEMGTMPVYKTPRKNIFLRYYEEGKTGKSMYINSFEGEACAAHYDYLCTLPVMGEALKKLKESGGSFPTQQIDHITYFKYGYLLFITLEPVPQDHDIFIRFAKVFEQTYTRFLDLQKAEAQVREAQIEAALEKVRSRSLAMHKTDELQEVVTVLVEKLQELGVIVDAGGVIICTYFKDSKDVMLWIASPDFSYSGSYLLPWFDHVIFNEAWESRLSGIDYFSKSYAVEDKNSFFEYAFEHSDYKNFPDDYKSWVLSQEKHSLSFAWAKNSAILIPSFTEIEPSESAKQILIRFAKVFEQAYVRFMDMQKAETQARESQIEAALERVRSRSMAMQRSEELTDVATILFQQVKALGVPQWTCGLNIWEIGDKDFTFYPGSPDGTLSPLPCKIPLTEDAVFILFDESRRRGDDLCVYESKGEIQEAHYRYMLSVPGGLGKMLQDMLDAGYTFPTFQIDHLANFSHGNLLFITYEHFPEMHDIFKRFAKVFEQTYTRFLDLQKAEAQAREAQIEAGLERVRSRSMGMQHSKELSGILSKIFEELTQLEVELSRCLIWIFNPKDHSVTWWISSPEDKQNSNNYFMPYINHPVYKSYLNAWQERKTLWEYDLSGELKKSWDKYLFNNSELKLLPKEVKASMRSKEQVFLTNSFNEYGCILVESLDHLSQTSQSIIQRFAKVFEQAYTRFADIQNAEASAREAVKQASLDRVRGEIASMRSKDDLNRITPLIWKELNALGVPFIRCGVFIMDDENQNIHTFLSTPTGESIAAFHLPYDTPGNFAEIVSHWKLKQNYIHHWGESEFQNLADILLQSGSISSREQYMSSMPKEGIHLNFSPFLQGMLYVGNNEPLNAEDLLLVQSLASAFSTAYARYEDFNRLESAKDKIEHTLTELKATQSQLIQAEKMASLGELTAGIAHEIQNPLNFVNNFSEVSSELIEELKSEKLKVKSERDEELEDELLNDISQNLQKINHHGNRASSIVKGMLQHSRTSTGQKEPTDINALADEYLRLSYHGMRAKDKSFNADFKTEFDESLPKINVIPQDIGRVLLNLINNAFYAVTAPPPPGGGIKKSQTEFKPTVIVRTSFWNPPTGGRGALISVSDNGPGIPQNIIDKIFQPFFTTKPTGQGTGLGLSLSYDIIKAHGGEIKVESTENMGTEFTVSLPIIDKN